MWYFSRACRALPLYGLTIISSCFILLFVLSHYGFHWNLPQYYSQDNLSASTFVKNIIDVGLSFKNPYLGAPLIADFSDYPLSDDATMVLLKALSLVSQNFVVVMNIFFFLSFPIAAIASLFVFRYLGVNKPFAFAASLLFAFLPFYFLRMQLGHFFLGVIYVIPLYVFFIFSILKNPLLFGPREIEKNQSRIKQSTIFALYVIACLFAASSGIYYAFFASIFLLLAGCMASIEKKRYFPLGNALAFVACISLIVLLNISPSMISRIEKGTNQEVAQRNPEESEYYGLKITELLLPTAEHRIYHAAKFRSYYQSTAPISNSETNTVTLGFVASIGFLSLLFILLLKNTSVEDNLFYLSRFNIAAVLFATVGGFSSLFAYFFTPMMRCPNRISVFIAFFSLAGFFLLLQKILHHFSSQKLNWIIALMIMFFGIAEQVPRQSLSADRAQYESDAKFIKQIEATMPNGAMIMQLPYIDFPESPSIAEMDSYALLRGYMHSHQLHWSFGAMRGRRIALWQKTLANKPMKEMLDDLVYAGFSGLYINRKGYPHRGQTIEKQISDILLTPPQFIDDTRTLSFYDLRPYANKRLHSMSAADWKTHHATIVSAIQHAGQTNN